MRHLVLTLAAVLALGSVAARPLAAQAADIPSASTAPGGATTPEQRGRALLDQMVTALGGQRWLDRTSVVLHGRTASFFRNAPTGVTTEYVEYLQVPSGTRPASERFEFISDKSPILPGKRRDVAQVWTADGGYELTYKGNAPLPRDQVDDYLRRRAHSIESIVQTWLKAPGVVVVAEGTSLVGRHLTDKVSILSDNNDAVTVELDSNTHLPLARTFQWRNDTFKDHDEDREEYDDYQPFDGLPTPLTLTRYRNGDMVNQRFLTKVEYNVALPPNAFNTDAALPRKK